MGCKSSKSYSDLDPPERDRKALNSVPPSSPARQSNGSGVSPPIRKTPSRKTKTPKNTLYGILAGAKDAPDKTMIWPEVNRISSKDSSSVFYVDPETGSTPLHLACGLVGYDFSDSQTVVDAIRSLIQIHPDALSSKDKDGSIPMHYAIAPMGKREGESQSLEIWKIRADILKILIASDYQSSNSYLGRNDVVFDANDEAGACSPLYRAIEQIPDDFSSPGPTVEYISVLQGPFF